MIKKNYTYNLNYFFVPSCNNSIWLLLRRTLVRFVHYGTDLFERNDFEFCVGV